jgi:hypothetical protein
MKTRKGQITGNNRKWKPLPGPHRHSKDSPAFGRDGNLELARASQWYLDGLRVNKQLCSI